MARVRLVTAFMPPMLSGIVSALAAEQERVDLVAQLETEVELLDAIERLRPDVLLACTVGTEWDGQWDRVLYRHPCLRLLTVSPDGRNAHLLQLVPDRVLISDVSARELVDVILGTGRYHDQLARWAV